MPCICFPEITFFEAALIFLDLAIWFEVQVEYKTLPLLAPFQSYCIPLCVPSHSERLWRLRNL